MKKYLALLLVLVVGGTSVGCGGQTANEADTTDAVISEEAEVNEEAVQADSVDALKEIVEKDVEDTIAALNEEYEQLKADIDSYDAYTKNTDKVEAFYLNIYEKEKALCIRLREYSLYFADVILSADTDCDDKYDELDELYDVIYDGAGDDIYDEIYDGILDDMYDDFYDGILDDAYDTVDYKEWSEARSNEYGLWSDTRSEVYGEWSDMRGDVYGFWSDMRGEMWDDDIEKAKEEMEDFLEDINKLKGIAQTNTSEITYDENDLGSIIDVMEADGEAASQYLVDEAAVLLESFGESYKGYKSHREDVTKFYENAEAKAEELYTTIRGYSMDYFKCVASEGIKDYSTWNGAMDDFYDAWNDAMDDFYETWDECYEDIYDECNDLIDDGSEQVGYDEYSEVWSAMYDEYSEAWSAMYEKYSDAWSETYNEYSDVWSGFYSGEADVEKILEEAEKEESDSEEKALKEADSEEADSEEAATTDEMRPEFKEAMDSYEAFYDEYCDMLKKYNANPTDLTILMDYADMLEELEDMEEKFAEWEDEDLNSTELQYYLEVTNRIAQKLLEVAED